MNMFISKHFIIYICQLHFKTLCSPSTRCSSHSVMSVDIEKAQLQFTACLGPEGDVELGLYIEAYEEIVKIFAYLGSVSTK